jgi:RimJ/RimL family protein N-acetyltransferase
MNGRIECPTACYFIQAKDAPLIAEKLHLNAPVLLTQRLMLRAHTLEDFEASKALWADPGVVEYIGGGTSAPNEVWMRILRYAGLWQLLNYGYWAVIDRETGHFIGEAGLADLHRSIQPSISGEPEAGWALRSHAHGRGLATEAMNAILGWVDEETPHSSTCCIIDPANLASVQVAAKLGYVKDGPGKFANGDTVMIYRRARLI